MFDLIVTLKSENGTLYSFSAQSEWSNEFIIDQATGFYGIYMVSIVDMVSILD